MYVDESTGSGYLVVCAVVTSGDVAHARTAMRGLLLPGQRSLHIKNERNRAARILETIVELDARSAIYRVQPTAPAMEARGGEHRKAIAPLVVVRDV